MTYTISTPTWRDAYDTAVKELIQGGYLGWGRARVYFCADHQDWVAEIG